MNAVAGRPALPEETAEAAAVWMTKADLDRLCAENRVARAKEARRTKRNARGLVVLVAAMGAAVVAEGAALAALLPTVRVEPVFVYLRDDGTSITSRSWDDMPANAREMNMVNVVSEYVRLREGWSSGEGKRAWDVVSALSTKEVRGQFQADYHRGNPNSPERLYGDRAALRVDVTDVQKDKDRAGAYRVYFNRTLRSGDQDGRSESMVATLRVRDVLSAKALPWWQRVQVNGPGIVVWEYPGATHTTPNSINGLPR